MCVSPALHNQVSIGFHKTNPKVLAHSSGVIHNLLEQNHWLPRMSRLERVGVTFDHERQRSIFDAQQLAATTKAAALSNMPDYNSAEFQQLKQQKGLLNMDLCQAAIECGMDITEVQREIVRLRAAGEISVKWSNMSFIVQVLEWPIDTDSHIMGDTSRSDVTLASIVDDLHTYLRKQECMSLEKLSIMSTTLEMANLPTMRCTTKDAVERGIRMKKQRLKYQKQQRQKRIGATLEDEPEEEEDEPMPFFDLHKVMGHTTMMMQTNMNRPTFSHTTPS